MLTWLLFWDIAKQLLCSSIWLAVLMAGSQRRRILSMLLGSPPPDYQDRCFNFKLTHVRSRGEDKRITKQYHLQKYLMASKQLVAASIQIKYRSQIINFEKWLNDRQTKALYLG